MSNPPVVSPPEWYEARLELLAAEKRLSHAQDTVRAHRRALPMVRIEKEYVFGGPSGKATLADLFEGRRQLIIYHFMWLPERGEGCPTCSMVGDNIGHLSHLHATNTTLALVSRTPWPDIAAFRERMGWTVPWYSSYGSDFNYDFHVSLDEAVAPVEYNYKDKEALLREGMGRVIGRENHGVSVFWRDAGEVYHTYSAYARGLDALIGTYHWLDLTPLGRQRYITEFPHHDRYDDEAAS